MRNVKHYVIEEGDTAGPYSGFFYTRDAAYVTYESCVMSGHNSYGGIRGSYDIQPYNAISVTYKNCTQANDILDSSLWGVMGSNFSKNLVYDGCVLSRFDAHCGVANATIKDSILGYCGANIIGYGTLLVEDTYFLSGRMFWLRMDYGGTWEGDVIIRNCKYYSNNNGDLYLFGGGVIDTHNYGYDCYAPINVIVDGLRVPTQEQIFVLGNLNPNHLGIDHVPSYPYYPTKTVTVKGLHTTSKKDLILSSNMALFWTTEFTIEK